MTNTYDTTNLPIGTTDVKALSNNASNFDEGMNSLSPSFKDRFFKRRQTWAGMEAQFSDFLAASGFVYLGDYAAGLTFSTRNQYMIRAGVAYRVATPTALPYTTIGDWAVDGPKFFAFSADSAVRQDLLSSDLSKGVSLVHGATRVVETFADLANIPAGVSRSVYVRGRFAGSNLGGGLYNLNTTSLATIGNGGTRQVTTAGEVFELDKNTPPTVYHFGARGDGVNDDTAAFNAAYSAEQRIRVPATAAFFKITAPVGSLTDGRGVVWEGDAGADSLVKLSGAGGFLVNGRSWEITGIRFQAVGTVPFLFKTGVIDDNHGCSFHDNFVDNSAAADYFTIVGECYRVWYGKFFNNFIRNGRFNLDYAGTGFQFSYSVNNVVYGNTIGACAVAVDLLNTPEPLNGYKCEGIFLDDNILLANNNHFRVSGGLYFPLTGNLLDLTGVSGNPVYATGAACVTLNGNWIASDTPCIIRGGDRHTICDNTFSLGDTQGFAIENADYGTMTGNNFLGGTIALGANTGCTGWIITGNQFTAQTSRPCDLSLLEDSQYSGNRENIAGLPSLLGPTVYSSPDEFLYTGVATLTAVPAQQISIALPAGRFSAAPSYCFISIASGVVPVLAIYDLAGSTGSVLRFTLYAVTGNLPVGALRFAIMARR